MRLCRVFITALFLASALLSLGRIDGATLEKIRFPYSPIAWNSLPWWMAKEARFFEKYGLDVEMNFEGASSVIVQAMLAGEANFAGLAGPAVVSNVVNGGDVIQVAAVVKTFTIPMYSQPSINEVAQLKGQKVGVSRFNSISHIAALNIFQRAGVTGATIIQTGGIPESAAALMSGNVAAAMVPPPQSVMLREKGFRELIGVKQFREWNIPVVENGVASRRSYAEKNPDVVKRFIRAAFEGIRQIYNNKELTMKTLAKYTKITDQKLLDESYRFSVEALSKDAFMPAEAFNALVEQMVSQKSIDAAAAKKIPVSAYFDNRYVDELEKEGFFKKLWQ
ncbi:MAG: ABC transporter substrate-binding protein [Deltaproteobacteria bacterium]|nr:MAG: ABC transporter substrate-binding protein [Deltaproteobacteria bacterium]